MIYQPRSIQPTYKSIDANSMEEISLVMNTSDKVIAYRLTIYDMNNNIVHQSDKKDFPVELYNGDTGFMELPTDIGLQNGNDYKWVARLYQPDKNMKITYGNIVEPTTYIYNVGNNGLSKDRYQITVNDYTYSFDTISELSSGDILSYNTYDELVTQIQKNNNSESEYLLLTNKIVKNNYASITMTNIGDNKYRYTVGSSGLKTADFHFEVDGREVWFTTLSDLSKDDYIEYDSTIRKLTQTRNNVTITLSCINAIPLNFTRSLNTTTEVFLKQNINIKDGMSLKINDEEETILSYDVNTGKAIVENAFSSVPTKNDTYYIYSDFIETTPENMLYVRERPVVEITNYQSTINTKEYTFFGSYTQSDDVPLVYFLWNLYSVDDNGVTLIKTSGKVYSANIQFYYDGFKPDETYRIELTCETEFGVSVTTQALNFNIDYPALPYNDQPVIVNTTDQGLRISWGTLTEVEPYSIYTKSAEGYLQSNNNTSSILYLERGQNIPPNSIILVGENDSRGIIQSYDINTGKTILSIPLIYNPEVGEYYHIYSEPNYDLNGIDILTDVPYNGVNSAKLNDNNLIYEKDGGISTWADDYLLTMQFRPDIDFFMGENGIYNDMIQIARYYGDTSGEYNDLIIYARNYNFGAITPARDDYGIIGGQIVSISEDKKSIVLSNDFTFDNKQYICFLDIDSIEYIDNYNSETKTITFNKALSDSELPYIDSYYYIYNSVESAFYDSQNNTFVLQSTNIKNPYNDYIWSDSESWNDEYYWVEGGTQIERAAENWWKLRITKDSITIRKGGV